MEGGESVILFHVFHVCKQDGWSVGGKMERETEGGESLCSHGFTGKEFDWMLDWFATV